MSSCLIIKGNQNKTKNANSGRYNHTVNSKVCHTR